jgi:hypothetical protein
LAIVASNIFDMGCKPVMFSGNLIRQGLSGEMRGKILDCEVSHGSSRLDGGAGLMGLQDNVIEWEQRFGHIRLVSKHIKPRTSNGTFR